MSNQVSWEHYAVAASFGLPFFFKPTGRFAAFAGKKGLKLGLRTSGWGVRAAANAAWATASTPFIRGGSFTPAKFAGSVAAGYALGAAVGTGISAAIYGKEGASKAWDFYTDPFDSAKWKTIGSGIASTAEDVWDWLTDW